MSDEIRTSLIVTAITKGFDKISGEFGKFGSAADKAAVGVHKAASSLIDTTTAAGKLAAGQLDLSNATANAEKKIHALTGKVINQTTALGTAAAQHMGLSRAQQSLTSESGKAAVAIDREGKSALTTAQNLDRLEQEARQATGANTALAASGTQVAASNAAVSATGGAVTATNAASAAGIMGLVKAGGSLLIGLYALERGYRAVKGAVAEMGDTGGAGFAQMEAAQKTALGTLLNIPIAGKGVLQWLDDAAAGLGNQMKLNAALVVASAQYVGVLNDEAAAHAAAALAGDAHAGAMLKVQKETEKAGKISKDTQLIFQNLAGGILNNAAMFNQDRKGSAIGLPRTDTSGYNTFNHVPGNFPNPPSPTNVALNIQVNAAEVLTAAQAQRIGQQVAGSVYEQFKRMGLQVQGPGTTR